MSGFFYHVHIMLLGLVEKMKDTMRHWNTMQYGENQMVNVNEIDYDLENEWDGNEWRNELVGLWYMKLMR